MAAHLSSCQAGDDLGSSLLLVMVVVALEGRADAKGREQLAAVPRVLGQNCVDRAQHAQRTERDVLQVSYGCCDEVQARRQVLPPLAQHER